MAKFIGSRRHESLVGAWAMALIEIPCEIVHTILEYVTASDIATFRLVNARLKVSCLIAQLIPKDFVDCFPLYKQLIAIDSLDSRFLPSITSQQLDRFYSPRYLRF